MSESEEDELLNFYSTSNVTTMFNKQVNMLKMKKQEQQPQNSVQKNEMGRQSSIVIPVPPVIDNHIADTQSVVSDQIPDDNIDVPDSPAEVIAVPDSPADTSRLTEALSPDVITLADSPINDSPDELAVEYENMPRRSKRNKKMPPAKLPVLPKKRQSKKKKKQIQEVIVCEENNDKDADDEDDVNYTCNVKIVWKSANIVKIPVRRLQKLSVVFEHFMEKENVSLQRIMLTLRGKMIKPTDTPESLNLNVIDFLEGGIVSSNVSCESSQKDAFRFVLKFQDTSKNAVILPINCSENFKAIMIGYAEQVDKPLSVLKFMLDGCEIENGDTVESLGLESGDVIDVIVKQ